MPLLHLSLKINKMKKASYYSVTINDGLTKEELQQRWFKEELWISIYKNFKNKLTEKEGLEKYLNELYQEDKLVLEVEEFKHIEKSIQLLDLRGLNLNDAFIKDIDLSYCCFDYSIFKNIVFLETGIQMSSFNNCEFQKIKMLHVQATAVSMKKSIWNNSLITGFFIQSNMEGSIFNNTYFDEEARDLVLF